MAPGSGRDGAASASGGGACDPGGPCGARNGVPTCGAVEPATIWCLLSLSLPATMARHLKFIARTVMVQNQDVEAAYRSLNKILTTDGIINEVKQRRYYEKPCRRKQRKTYELCRRIYSTEMARKISFLLRKNRPDPWLGC